MYSVTNNKQPHIKARRKMTIALQADITSDKQIRYNLRAYNGLVKQRLCIRGQKQ